MDNKAWDLLSTLKSFTNAADALLGEQVEQLKVWGYLAFQHLDPKEIQIQVNFEHKEITYLLDESKKKPKHRDFAKHFELLKNSVFAMLGDQWKVKSETSTNARRTANTPTKGTRKSRAKRKGRV